MSTSNFQYALSTVRARCDYQKLPKAWNETANALDWKATKSDLPFDTITDESCYLFTCEKVPGTNERRYISCLPIDVNEYKNAFCKNEEVSKMFNQMTCSFGQYMKHSLDSGECLPLIRNIGVILENACVPIISPFVGSNTSTSNMTMPLGESATEKLELIYRGEFFTHLWQFLYEENNNEKITVTIDPDEKSQTEILELGPITLNTYSEITQFDRKTVIEIQGNNLNDLKTLIDTLGKHGNDGHSYTFIINKKKIGFDGDGSDHVFKTKLIIT